MLINKDVTVKGELGVLAGIEDDGCRSQRLHQPGLGGRLREENRSGFISHLHRNSHGANKFKPEQCTRNADGILVSSPLRFDIPGKSKDVSPGFPIVSSRIILRTTRQSCYYQ